MAKSKVQQAQHLFTRLGYNVTHDTRMGLNRLHVWHTTVSNIMPATIEGSLRRANIRGMTVKKHSEQGVWIYTTGKQYENRTA